MSNRVKHRRDALARRTERVEQGLPADPSHRVRKPARGFRCPCGVEHRHMFGIMMHLNLLGDHGEIEVTP